MAIQILINESDVSRRAVPIWLVQSNGTSAATNESGRTFMFSIGNRFYGSGGSLSAVSAIDGLYDCVFSASKISVLGPGQVMYSSGTALPMSTPFEVVPINSYDSMRLGLFALPNAAAEAAGGLLTFGTATGQLHTSGGSVGLKAQTHSQATIQGVTRVLNLSANDDKAGYSISGTKTTLDALNDIDGSGVTLHAGTHSGATVQGVTRVNSSVTPANALYSAITVRVDPQNYSGLTVGTGNLSAGIITSAQFGAGAIDAAALATDAGQEVADRVLARGLATGSDGGRTVQDALRGLRNRVAIGGSTITVYQEDDTTSAWTGSVTTVASTLGVISSIDPLG